MRSPANVVNVFIRILEFGLVARQPLLVHVAKWSRMRPLSFSGLLSYWCHFLVKHRLLRCDFHILGSVVHTYADSC